MTNVENVMNTPIISYSSLPIIFIMTAMMDRLMLSRQQGASSRQDLSISHTEQQDCSVSSLKYNSELNDLVSILKQFVQLNRKSQAEGQVVAGREVDPRDRAVVVGLPQELSQVGLERFMTKLCGEVWSRAFHYYSTNQLSFQNTKIYSSQQILQNLARLCQKHPLQSHHFAVIDHHLQSSVLEYMLQKYPMTLSQEINRNLNNAIREIDNADSPAHDFLRKSNFTFKYRETGEYNDLIMRTINEAINRIEARSDNQSVYQRFQDNMTLLFESVSDYEWMHKGKQGKEAKQKEGRMDSRGDLKGQEEQAEGHWLLTLTLNNSLQRKMTMDGETLRSQYIKMKQKQKSNYEQKVKQYTHYKINKKLPESARLFTEEQITSHRMKIESPQILRILTKWCSELQRKFQGPDCFEHFVHGVSLEKSANLSLLLGEVRESLGELIREEKVRIQQELSQLASNNFSMQSELLRQKLAGAEFSQVDRHERISAQFSIDIVNNLHSYIIAYLNRLIHGLLAVWRRFQKLPGVELLELAASGAGIVSFQVMDLVRCKCTSREKEILRIYNELLRMCEVKTNMSLVRVVNRLRRGTNDILINIMYRDVLCEIQLAVTTKENTFLQYSNAFNHYLYELKRSVFGPLTELAGIWKNLDARFNIYKTSGGISDSSMRNIREGGAHGCGGLTNFVAYNRPFICSQCSQHYFHNKFVKKHIKCATCDYWLCARCQIKESDCLELLTAAFHNQDVVRKCRKLDNSNRKSLPNYGMCVYIESQEIIVEPFRKYTSDKSTEKIMGIKNKRIYQIYDTSTQRQRSKFIAKFLIFEMEEEFGSRAIKISNEAVKHYLTEEKFRHTIAKNKDAVSLNNEGLNDQQLHALTTTASQEQLGRIKGLQLMGNRLITTTPLEQFPNLLKVELSKNRVTDFSAISRLRKLQRVVLSDNDLKEFPQELCTLTSLREITINQNSIKSIPVALKQCTGLTMLHLTSNKLTELPSFLFELPQLVELSATSNFIKEVPQAIQLARKLKYLSLQNNYIKSIPRQVQFLVDLERLNLSYNKIAELPPLGTLRSLKHLNLRHNSLTNIDQLLATTLNIREMDLSYNDIKAASSFDNHHLLKFLNLSHNAITQFPLFTRSCANLKHLLLSNNKLTIMGTLEHLLSLEELDLSCNAFQTLHPSLSRLENLVVVHLESNQLNSFSSIHMEHIVKLFLRRNCITDLRGLQMRRLEQLDASQNQLTCFQGNFLPKLKKLNLNINQLQSLELGSFLKISVVQAARNQLRHMPGLHPSNQLKFLNLEHNFIEEIPRPLLTSSHINTLNLSSNRIRVIPRELQNLHTLKEKSLFLQKNPLEVVQCPQFISNKCGYDLRNDINGLKSDPPPQEITSELLISQTHAILPP